MSTPRRSAAVLAASERAAWYLVETGGFSAPIAEIAAAIGLHERTFYRYFPTKPDALRPLFDWGAALLADRIVERPDLSVDEAVLSAFAEVVGGEHAERTRRLFPLVFADPTLRGVLLAVYHDAEGELREAVAARTGLEPDAAAVHLAAARVVMTTRLALELHVEQGRDPLDALRELHQLLPGPLAEEPTEVKEAP